MSTRRATGDGGRGRPQKKPKYETLSDDDEWEQPPPSSGEQSDVLIYDYVPNTDMGDIVVEEPNGMSDLVLAKCRGCMREFGIEGNADMRQFVQHCLRGCDAYQLQAIAAQCDVCRRYCMDDAALVKHRTSPDSRCPLPDSSHTKSDVVPLSPVAGPSRCTTIEVVSDPVVRGKAGNEPTDVITISDNRPATPRLDGVCYEYVPDATTGDVVVWSGTSETIEATVCKGCQQVFPTLQTREQVDFVNHCITCPEYQQLNLIKYCYPCRLNCMDQNAFIQHILNSDSCPAQQFLTFKSKRNGPSSSRTTNGKTHPDTIQLD